jgi:hypothetical protein
MAACRQENECAIFGDFMPNPIGDDRVPASRVT